MRRMVMIVAIVMAVMVLRVDVGMARENSCQTIYVDVKKKVLYKATGACFGGGKMASYNTQKLCERNADSSGDCVAGEMASVGYGLTNLSTCGSDVYIGIACVVKGDRPYCSVGCGHSQFAADDEALQDCSGTHHYKNCKVQHLNE